jgi:hypothetical protein
MATKNENVETPVHNQLNLCCGVAVVVHNRDALFTGTLLKRAIIKSLYGGR